MPNSDAFFRDAHEPGTTALPRRVGFFVRHRARVGLMPGQVSTAALIQARRLRRLIWWLGPVFIVFLLLPVIAVAASGTKADARQIAAVVGPSGLGQGPAPFEVVLDDGKTMFFDSDPGVRAGQVVLVRRRGSSNLLGLVVDGRYIASTKDQGTPTGLLVAVFLFIALVFGVGLVPAALWGRRAYKQLDADLKAPLAEGRGRYIGSWTWRAMSGRAWGRGNSLGIWSGFPIAIEEQQGVVSWYGAPVWMLAQVRHFETEITGTSRAVVFTFHPNTRALARIATPDDACSLDFKPPLDELHPETGLSLKVSKRRRNAHLPDR